MVIDEEAPGGAFVACASAAELMRKMGLDDAEIERRKSFVGLGSEDLRRIQTVRQLVEARADEIVEAFFRHLETFVPGSLLFKDPELQRRARALKRRHLLAMVAGEYGHHYVEERLELALVYSQAELDLTVFMGAYDDLLKTLAEVILASEADPGKGYPSFAALKKVAFFDLALFTGVLIFSRETTIRHLGEQASQYARSLIEASLDPLVTISPDGKITDVNEATATVTGVLRENLIGSDFSDFFTEPEKAREGYRQVFEKGFVTDYPLTIRHRDGRLTDVLYNASVYKDTGGNVLGVFAAARDVTTVKRAEAEVAEQRARELERLAELERFHKLTIGRELKMIELKKEIARLATLLGESP